MRTTATATDVGRKTCPTCEASPDGCESLHLLRGAWCCSTCTGNHDDGQGSR